jgi:hypothetical protein
MDDECHESRDRSGASFNRDPFGREIPVARDISSALRKKRRK